ncbi:MAG: hypothetical protein ACE5K7_03445, partial [Phycisphaerae bacterium]
TCSAGLELPDGSAPAPQAASNVHTNHNHPIDFTTSTLTADRKRHPTHPADNSNARGVLSIATCQPMQPARRIGLATSRLPRLNACRTDPSDKESTLLLDLDPKQKARYAEAARLSAYWFLRSQNTPQQPWGGVHNSADEGRFIYEYYPVSGYCRGMGVWGQAVGILSLLALRDSGLRMSIEGTSVERACLSGALLAARYLMSLQILDGRDQRKFGAFREHTPQSSFSFPRDAATGCFGLLALHRLTHRQEYLEPVRLFCNWYRRYGSDERGWPVVTFPFQTCQPRDQHHCGIWQAGGGLVYYYLAELTGEKRWLEEGLQPIAERALEMFDRQAELADGGEMAAAHGLHGNDDFATLTMLAAYRSLGDQKYLQRFGRNINTLLANQHPDGSFRNYAGCFVAGLTMLDALQLGSQLPDFVDRSAVADALRRLADFGLTNQELHNRDRRAYGGMYGQSPYHAGKERIHQRSTGYASVLYSRLVADKPLPYFSALNWTMTPEPLEIAPPGSGEQPWTI